MHVYNILDMTYFGYNYKTQISSNYKLQIQATRPLLTEPQIYLSLTLL